MSKITIESNRDKKKLTEEEDYLGTIPKAKAIQAFLEGGNLNFEENQMFALFGDWGSGKTTLFNYLQEELQEKEKFKSIFFEAWKYETDENLPLSLMEMLTDELGTTAKAKKITKEVLEHTFNILVGFAKAVSVKTPFGGFNPKVVIEEAEKSVEAFERKSVASNIKEFEKSFQKLENSLLKKEQTLIVFIDDLDRCEPENVIKLLSAIKLFFTYGKRTIFFFGVDKKAIEEAVKTKYKDIVKSSEYLEKIFDFSFEAPRGFDLYKMMQRHFPTKYSSELDIAKEISRLFESMQFTNPRHVKKVLNKYSLLKSYKHNEHLDKSLKNLIPEIITNGEDGNLLETAISLYLIVLYEFDYELFKEVEDVEGRKTAFFLLLNEKIDDENKIFKSVNQMFGFWKNHEDETVQSIMVDSIEKQRKIRLRSFYSLFMPKIVTTGNNNMVGNLDDYFKYFDNKSKKPIGFVRFIENDLINNIDRSELNINSIPKFFKMVRTVL
jgi:energy-coupling factor transporter ATP-binding protein EcfA2